MIQFRSQGRWLCSFLRVLGSVILQQDNTRLNVAVRVLIYLDMEVTLLLLRPPRSPDLSPLKTFCLRFLRDYADTSLQPLNLVKFATDIK
ncbi:hypothetical protein TNCV_1652341 [Trichonephila clavipes]|nr:hypothetical protein TNCV_1652341 [Trichonephila clavipes]